MHQVPRARSQIINRYGPGTKNYALDTKGEAPRAKEFG